MNDAKVFAKTVWRKLNEMEKKENEHYSIRCQMYSESRECEKKDALKKYGQKEQSICSLARLWRAHVLQK